MITTYGELRKLLKKSNVKWMPNEKLNDQDNIPHYSLGGGDQVKVADPSKKVDFQATLSFTSNPFVLERRKEYQFDSPNQSAVSKRIINPHNLKVTDINDADEHLRE